MDKTEEQSAIFSLGVVNRLRERKAHNANLLTSNYQIVQR